MEAHEVSLRTQSEIGVHDKSTGIPFIFFCRTNGFLFQRLLRLKDFIENYVRVCLQTLLQATFSSCSNRHHYWNKPAATHTLMLLLAVIEIFTTLLDTQKVSLLLCICILIFFKKNHSFPEIHAVFFVLQGPPGRPGLPGSDGVPGLPGTILMLPVSSLVRVHWAVCLSSHITHSMSSLPQCITSRPRVRNPVSFAYKSFSS